MTNHEITGKQAHSMFIMFWLGTIVVMGINPDVKQDTWISILMASVMVLPLLALLVRIVHLYPGLNLFEILMKIFGNFFGRILSIIFVLFSIHLGSMVINLFTTFINVVSMPTTPEILTATFLILFAIWSVKNGPENIGRVSKTAWTLLTLSVFVTVLIAMPEMDFNYLKPVMEADFKSLLGAAFSTCMLPMAEMILFLSFFSSINQKESASKILIKSLVYMTITFLVITLRNVLVLGVPTALMVDYPSYASVSAISVGSFFTRVEALTGINLFLTGFIKLTVLLYISSLGLTKVINVPNHNTMVVPCALLMFTLSGMLYANSQTLYDWLKVYPFFSIPFEIILPVVIWIGAEIQTKLNPSKPSKPETDSGGKGTENQDTESQAAESQDTEGQDAESQDSKSQDVKNQDAKSQKTKGKDAKNKDAKGKNAEAAKNQPSS